MRHFLKRSLVTVQENGDAEGGAFEPHDWVCTSVYLCCLLMAVG